MTNTNIVFQKTKENQDELDLRPIIWVTEFDFDSAVLFSKKLTDYENDKSVKEIFIYISSYGGQVMALIAMLDTLLNCKKPIHSVVIGSAASCGAILSIAVPGKRFIGELSSLHIHHIRTIVCEDLPGIEQETKTLNKIEAKLFKIIAKRSGLTITKIRNKLKEENREWHISSGQALKWGFVDIIGIPKLRCKYIVECEY